MMKAFLILLSILILTVAPSWAVPTGTTVRYVITDTNCVLTGDSTNFPEANALPRVQGVLLTFLGDPLPPESVGALSNGGTTVNGQSVSNGAALEITLQNLVESGRAVLIADDSMSASNRWLDFISFGDDGKAGIRWNNGEVGTNNSIMMYPAGSGELYAGAGVAFEELIDPLLPRLDPFAGITPEGFWGSGRHLTDLPFTDDLQAVANRGRWVTNTLWVGLMPDGATNVPGSVLQVFGSPGVPTWLTIAGDPNLESGIDFYESGWGIYSRQSPFSGQLCIGSLDPLRSDEMYFIRGQPPVWSSSPYYGKFAVEGYPSDAGAWTNINGAEINFSLCPTSDAGLATGRAWVSNGFVRVVQ